MQILLIVLFVVFVLIGVPISYALGFVSFAGIAALPIIPNSVVFTKMFNGLNSFTLLAVPLFILAANLMNEGSISDRLIDVCKSSVGHVRGGLAHANILVSMIFAGISGSSQADTAGIGKILIPAMEKQGYDKGTAVGVTAASSTLGSIILIGGIVSGLFTPTESAAVACVYALIIGIFFYHTIKISRIPAILIETMKLSSLSLFALATANALGELMSYYQLNEKVQGIFVGMPGGKLVFLIVVVLFFMFVGTFMDAVPAMILFVPIILPSATALGVSPIILGLIVVVTLALGLVTPPYGLCLLLAGSISGISIEDSFKGVLPYFLSSIAVLALMIVFSDVFLAIPTALFPNLF